MKPPSKYKALEDFNPDDHYRALRGERVLSDEYIAYKNDALHAAGLGDEVVAEAAAKPLSGWAPEDHLADIQRKQP